MEQRQKQLQIIEYNDMSKKENSSRIKKRLNETHTFAKRFKPMRKMYIALLAISVILSFLCIYIPKESPWFSIGTGIACGGVASTIVAWLIDEVNSKKSLEKAQSNRDILYQKLLSPFENGLQLLINSLICEDNNDNPRVWHEWIKCAHLSVNKNPNLRINDYCQFLQAFFVELEEATGFIISVSTMMLEYGILDKKDIDIISLLGNLSGIARVELDSRKVDEQVVERIKLLCDLMQTVMAQSSFARPINEKKIEPLVNRFGANNEMLDFGI